MSDILNSSSLNTKELKSIILVGGMGTRLNESRKMIDTKKFPQMSPEFQGEVGPKGLALLSPSWTEQTLPLTDWHLAIHKSSSSVKDIYLALGCRADLMMDYYKNSSLKMLEEKNPAGTLAPLIKLYVEKKLDDGIYIYANGDNLADIDFDDCLQKGIDAAVECGIGTDAFVIDIASLVPWEESDAYGTLDMDFESGLVHSFKEKGPVEENKYIEVDGLKKTPINSGFSIIVNPLKLFKEFLDEEVVQTSLDLEAGKLSYKGNEKTVKYETFYEKLAAKKKMVAVLHKGYWTDLGTEEKLIQCETELPEQFFS